MTRIGILCLLLVVAVGTAQAKIYKWVLPDGSVVYSDRPQEEGAREVELPPIQTFSPPPTPRDAGETESKEPEKTYDSVKVVSPQNDEAVRDNGGTVSVQIDLTPPLHPGHTVEILLDGKPIGKGRGTTATVTNVDRGTHSVSAVVKDADGKTVASAPGVTFHLKRVSRLN